MKNLCKHVFYLLFVTILHFSKMIHFHWLMKNHYKFLLLNFFIPLKCLSEIIIDLTGDYWNFSTFDLKLNGTAIVPGDIYTDLWKAGIIPDDPLKVCVLIFLNCRSFFYWALHNLEIEFFLNIKVWQMTKFGSTNN